MHWRKSLDLVVNYTNTLNQLTKTVETISPDTRQCKAEGGICKQTCAVDEEDTGRCCRHSYRCCQPTPCDDTLQYKLCTDINGLTKPVCVNEADTGIGPFCNNNRCCTCGGTFNGPDGSFASNRYPSNYCNNHDYCIYNITVKKGSRVMLNFTSFHIEDNSDSVGVYDGEISRDTYLASLTGGPKEGIEFTSTSNTMIIRFYSDSSIVYSGFNVSYQTLQ
ncbi:tumor necrosis factor-inducible gene 6 protein-like isoform X2 [Mytilus edulis]|uniref:tumor necrosis factor-inducible gene 6 protein-like isoform X2 n=1 Tax=Mytilus edulis TaxID=6550 RepID=UPI0039EE9632